MAQTPHRLGKEQAILQHGVSRVVRHRALIGWVLFLPAAALVVWAISALPLAPKRQGVLRLKGGTSGLEPNFCNELGPACC